MNRLGRLQSLTDQLKQRVGAAPVAPSADGRGWTARRGEIRAVVDCDVIGNFPGFHQSAALIVAAKTLVTSRYLIVDEGQPHGFALALTSLTDVNLDDAAHAGPDLIVRFRQPGGEAGWFRLRESRGRLRRKGTRGAEALRAALRDGHVSFGEAAAGFNAYLLVDWDAAASLESDRVVWSGHATAPIRATLECAPTEIWVTANSLIWGGVKGEGINRLPLSAIRGLNPVTLSDAETTPAVFVSTFGPENILVSLPFIFDAQANIGPERDEFVRLFSPTLVGEVDAAPPLQPWLDPEPEAEEDADLDIWDERPDVSASAGDEAAHESGFDDEPGLEDDDSLPAWETWSSARPPSRFSFDGGGSAGRTTGSGGTGHEPARFDSSGMRLTEALSGWPGTSMPAAESTEEPEEEAPLVPVAIPAYLTTARNAIAEVDEVIDYRLAGKSALSPRTMPPSSEEQAAALAELVELASGGYYGAEAARAVKVKITRLGEAAIRVRSLLELCNAGHLTIKEAGARRDTILAGLPMDDVD